MKVQTKFLAVLFLAITLGACDSSEEVNGNSITPPSPTDNACGNIPHGAIQTRLRYAAPQAASPESKCISEIQTRTCSNGAFTAWTGTYTVSSCSVPGHPSCSLTGATTPGVGAGSGTGSDANGVPHGGLDYRIRYEAKSVPWDAKCKSQTQSRTCTDGVFSAWSGTYSAESCAVTKPLDCLNEKKEKVAHGVTSSRVRYATDWVPFGSKCVSEEQTQTCTNGVLSKWTGTLTFETCKSPYVAGLSVLPELHTSVPFNQYEIKIASGDNLILTAWNQKGVKKPFRYDFQKREFHSLFSPSIDDTINDSPSNYVVYRGEVYFADFDSYGKRALYKYSKDFGNLKKVFTTSSNNYWAIPMIAVANGQLYFRAKKKDSEFPLFYVLNEQGEALNIFPKPSFPGNLPSPMDWNGLPNGELLFTLRNKIYYNGIKVIEATSTSYRSVSINGTSIPVSNAIFEYNSSTGSIREIFPDNIVPHANIALDVIGVSGSKLILWQESVGLHLFDPEINISKRIEQSPFWINETPKMIGGVNYFPGKTTERVSVFSINASGTLTQLVENHDQLTCSSGCFYIPNAFHVQDDVLYFPQTPTDGPRTLKALDLKSKVTSELLGSDFKFTSISQFHKVGTGFSFVATDSKWRTRIYFYVPLGPSPSPSASPRAEAKPANQ